VEIRLLISGLINRARAGLAQCETLFKRHPRRILAVAAGLALTGTGGTWAIASFAPDASEQPIRQVVEMVTPLPIDEQREALDLQRFNLFRSEVSRTSDTAESLLRRLSVQDPAAVAFLKTDTLAQRLLFGRQGRLISAEINDIQELQSLTARWSPEDNGQFQRLIVRKNGKTFESRLETGTLTSSTRLASGVIRSSLFAATDDARIPDAIAIQIAEIFSGDIDFHRALRKDDRFSVTYEVLESDGEVLRTGRVLAVEFVNQGKSYQAMWFQDPTQGGKGGYYNLDGQSLRRAYLTSPMEFSRVTSGFKMRFHPILNQWRAHLGVDYGAPTGTPVRTVGDGVVEFAGVQNGFGNVVFVKHRGQHTTVYAHLSKIQVQKGQSVNQGQTIGLVGATGWATGPHLHFEFRVNGVHEDPMTLARQSEAVPVSAAARPQFNRQAQLTRLQLDAAQSMSLASAE